MPEKSKAIERGSHLLATIAAPYDQGVKSEALREACAFLSANGVVKPAQCREAERVIAALFDRGLYDVNRLAIKAIVRVS